MKLTRTFKIHPALFGIVPVVNVLFLVLIFFAISSRFVLQPGMAITLPASSFTLGPREGAQIISVTSTPVPAIYFHEQHVSLDELRQRLTASGAKHRSIVIKADKATPYEFVIQIADEASRLGFSVVLATNSERR